MTIPMPTPAEVARAREVFERREPRDVFYRAATALVDLALAGQVELSLAEAIAVLLRTWNMDYYRFRPRLGAEHFNHLEKLLARHARRIPALRTREITGLMEGDEQEAKALFAEFEALLRPVGAAKALHLLAPRFFPLWDRKIAAAYHLALGRTGTNATRYWRLMEISRDQARALVAAGVGTERILKALDEYNYCRFTNEWT